MVKKKRKKRGGFSYQCSDEELKEYMALPAKWKLRWLIEANEFFSKIAPRRTQKLWEKFRKGEI